MANRKNKKKEKAAPVLTQSTRPAKPLFRLIPVTMIMAGGLLCLKAVEIYETGRSLRDELLVSTVVAEDAVPEEKAEAKPAEQPKAEGGEHAAAEPAKEGEGEGGEEGEAAPAPPPVDFFESRDKGYNQRELDVLESLSERREKLDKLEKDLSLREKVLQATEQRIDTKIGELNDMSKELKELLVTYDKEEDAKISSTVKIYEAMKPKDAARIFDQMDMGVLLMVIDRMKERKVAPILAAMSPEKAKNVTEELAAQQKSRPKAATAEDAATDGTPYNPPLF